MFGLFFEVPGVPNIALKSLLAASGHLLVASWRLLGLVWSVFEASWGLLGAWEGFLGASAAGTSLKPSFFRGPRGPRNPSTRLRDANVTPFGPGGEATEGGNLLI